MRHRPPVRASFGAAAADRRRFTRIGHPRAVRFAPYPACTPWSPAVLGGYSLWGGCMEIAKTVPSPAEGDILLVEPSAEAGAIPGSAMAARVRWVRKGSGKGKRTGIGIQFLPLSAAARETLLRWMRGK